jgi:Endodeoxyribonuclease RusA
MQQIWIPGRAIGKARPRFSSQGIVYTSERYRNWKTSTIVLIKSLNLQPAPKPCFIECFFVNFFSSDADNVQGAVIDSLVQAEYLENDSCSYVVGCSGLFVKQRKRRNEQKSVGVLVQVYPASVRSLEDVQQVFISSF